MLRNHTTPDIHVEELEIEEVVLGAGNQDDDLALVMPDFDAFQERMELQAAREQRTLKSLRREIDPFLL